MSLGWFSKNRLDIQWIIFYSHGHQLIQALLDSAVKTAAIWLLVLVRR